jgi:D-threo-aldose 1-dehydrogenase
MRAMSDLRFSRLGYGAASIGNHRKALSDETAWAVLEAAWECGVRHFDTAPHYGLGLSERRLGEFLATRPRSEFVVTTKVGRLLEPTPGREPPLDDAGFLVPATHRRVWDFSAAGVRRSLEESLRRLRLDAVDVVYLHDPERWDLERGLRSGVPAAAALREEGLTEAVGLGSMDRTALLTAARTADVDILMVAGRYTLADQAGSEELLAACRENDVDIVVAAVFNGGLLAEPPGLESTFDYALVPTEVLERVQRIDEICRSFGVPLRMAALRYPLLDASVLSVVAGGTSPDQVRENARALAVEIPAQLWETLRARGLVV